MTDYLSPAELHDLTDTPQPARQITWLRRHGWRFAVGYSGHPRVLRAYRDKRLGAGDAEPVAKVEPDWSKVA